MEKAGDSARLPEGVVHGLIAFTFATFLVVVAFWPSGAGPAPAGEVAPVPGEDHQHDPVAGENIVGKEAYYGPVTAQEVADACKAAEGSTMECYKETLKALLVGRGAMAAFDALDNLTAVDPTVSGQGHSLAHDLGRYAFVAYGSIQEALANCSYKAFQGCFHGALQSYLEALPNVQGSDLLDLCPSGDRFRESTCVHGIGHGVMLNTNANVNASLELCNALRDDYQRGSCWSGVFMENLVGYYEGQRGAAHNHGNHTGPPGYIVNRPGDPYFPCSVMQTRYLPTCWQQQADYILFANGSDFREAAELCDKAPDGFAPECRRSLGRDASGWYRDVDKAVLYCSYGDPQWRPYCIRGMAAEVVLYFFDPVPGVEACKQVPDQDKSACYSEIAGQGSSMVGSERMGEVCAQAEEAYVNECRRGAGLAAI